MQRTVAPVRKSCILQNLEPEFSAAYSHLVHRAVSLADRPYQAEIPDRSPAGLQIPLKYTHTLAATRGVISVGQAEDSRTDDGDVRSLFHPITGNGDSHGRITERLLDCDNSLIFLLDF